MALPFLFSISILLGIPNHMYGYKLMNYIEYHNIMTLQLA